MKINLIFLAMILTLSVSAQRNFNESVTIHGYLQLKTWRPEISFYDRETGYSADLNLSNLTNYRAWYLPDNTGTIALTSDVYRTINTSTIQTSATLNATFPNAEPGTKVVNLDATLRYMYIKVGDNEWRRSELMTNI